VNGTRLIGVTNEQAIGYLKSGAKTGSVRLVIARDEAAQMDYKRLIASISNGLPPRLGTQPPPMPPSVNDSTVSQSSTVGSDFEDTDRVQSPGDIELREKTPSDMNDSNSEVTMQPDYDRRLENRPRMASPKRASFPGSQRYFNTERKPFENGPMSSTPVSNDLTSQEIEGQHSSSSSPNLHVLPLESTRRVPNYQTNTGDTYASILPRQDRHSREGLTVSQKTMTTTTYTNGDTVESSPSSSPTTNPKAAVHTPLKEELGPRKPLPYRDHITVRDSIGSSQSGRKLPQPVVSSSPISSPPPDPGYATVGSSVGGVKIGVKDYRNPGSSSPELDLKLPGQVKFLTIHKRKGLGISVIGGIDHPDEGPLIYIEKIVEESDAFQDGSLHVGDILVSVNGESLVGVKLQEAQAALTRVRLRSQLKNVRIGYVSGAGVSRRSSLRSQSSISSTPRNQQHGSASSLSRTPSDTPIIGPPRTRTDSNPYSRHTREVEAFSRDGNWGKQGSHDSAVHCSESPEHTLHRHWSVGRRNRQSADSGVFDPRESPMLVADGLNSRLVQKELHKEPQEEIISSASSVASSPRSVRRRLSIDPECKLQVEKLEVALRYLGIEPTEDQQEQLRAQLHIDPSGCVIYSEFVQVARELFSFQLDERAMNTDAMFYATNVETSELPSLPQAQSYSSDMDTSEQVLKKRISEQAVLQHKKLAKESMNTPGHEQLSTLAKRGTDMDRKVKHSHERDLHYELERLRKEKEEALRKVEQLKVMYEEKCQDFNIVEQESRRQRKDIKKLNSEMQATKKRLHLAEAARKQARNMEMDYESVIRDMRKEMQELRASSSNETSDDYQRRCAVLQCQLKKLETSKRNYEVATDKLLKFAQMAHEVLTEAAQQGNGSIIIHRNMASGEPLRRGDAFSGNPRPPSYLTRQARQTSATLAKEAQETVASVKALVDDERKSMHEGYLMVG
jgi:syntaxin-binding protein 4